jgi:hypothetical protein
MSEAREAHNALKQADAATRRGDLKDAQHWSKVAEQLSKSAERLASLPPPEDDGAAEEARRAELRRRIAMFVDASNDCEKWEEEAAIYHTALANGLDVEPLRPHPAGELGENEYLDRIARGEL